MCVCGQVGGPCGDSHRQESVFFPRALGDFFACGEGSVVSALGVSTRNVDSRHSAFFILTGFTFREF